MTHMILRMFFCQTYLSELINLKVYAAKPIYVNFKVICALSKEFVSFLNKRLKCEKLAHIRVAEQFDPMLKGFKQC